MWWGAGAGGRISTGGSSIGAYMRKVAALERAVEKDEDPREAILKYAKVISPLFIALNFKFMCSVFGQVAEDNPYWVNPAYKG